MAKKFRQIPDRRKPILDQTKSSTEKDEKLIRGNEVTRRDDNVEGPSVGLLEIDTAFQSFLSKEIKPEIYENGQLITIPVLYSDSEKWNSIQREGFLRDQDGKVMTPVIIFKRSSLSSRSELAKLRVLLDSPENSRVFKKQYSSRNRYDKFSILQNQKPVEEYYYVRTPDYISIQYSVIIWTNLIEDLNKIVESIIHIQGGGFGQRYKFDITSNDYEFDTSNNQGEDRIVRCNITLTVNAYIIPKNVSGDVTLNKGFSTSKIVFNTDAESTTLSATGNSNNGGTRSVPRVIRSILWQNILNIPTGLISSSLQPIFSNSESLTDFSGSISSRVSILENSPGGVILTGSYATTGSNIFTGNQIITGSIYVSGFYYGIIDGGTY